MLLNHQNEDLASVGDSARKKSNSNISPLGHDRDKLKLISMMMRTRRRMKRGGEEDIEDKKYDNGEVNEEDNNKSSFW